MIACDSLLSILEELSPTYVGETERVGISLKVTFSDTEQEQICNSRNFQIYQFKCIILVKYYLIAKLLELENEAIRKLFSNFLNLNCSWNLKAINTSEISMSRS